MGLCHEFGTQIRDGCEHPMRAGSTSCSCPDCGVSCDGLFEGCPDVWARGPQPVTIVAGRASSESPFGPEDPLSSPSSITAGLSEPGPIGGSGPAGPRVRGARQGNRGPRSKGPRSAPGAGTGGRADVVDWFDGAFEGLRQELRSLSSGMTQQEAMVAELLDTRQGELRLVLVAEALPDLVAEAVRQAMGDHLAGVTESFDVALGQFRQELKRMKKANDAAIEGMHESVEKALAGVRDALESHTAELRETDASRSRAIKGSVTRQVAPLVAALDESAARSDAAIALLARKMDRMSAAIEKGLGTGAKTTSKPAANGAANGTSGTPTSGTPTSGAATTGAAKAKPVAKA